MRPVREGSSLGCATASDEFPCDLSARRLIAWMVPRLVCGATCGAGGLALGCRRGGVGSSTCPSSIPPSLGACSVPCCADPSQQSLRSLRQRRSAGPPRRATPPAPPATSLATATPGSTSPRVPGSRCARCWRRTTPRRTRSCTPAMSSVCHRERHGRRRARRRTHRPTPWSRATRGGTSPLAPACRCRGCCRRTLRPRTA